MLALMTKVRIGAFAHLWRLGASAALAVILAMPVAQAQSKGDSPPGNTPPASGGHAQPQPPKSGAKPDIATTIPDSALERAKLLDNLYALLATAEDEASAEQTTQAIHRVWRTSGSDTVDLLLERAIKAAQEKNTELATKLLDAVVELAPDYAEGWNQRAQLFYIENDYQRALGDIRRVLALDPNHFRALEALGQILRELGEKKGALEAFQKLLEVNPFASGAKQNVEELKREVSGQGI
jgi:tetratricopeptide (TPR) repeat protein